MNRRKVSFILIGAFVLGLVCVMGVAWWVMESHAVNVGEYQQVREGMTTDQVKMLLGQPSLIEKGKNGESIWKYSSQWTWCIGYVSFGLDSKVKEKEHDH